jgi:WD40 repeat protein
MPRFRFSLAGLLLWVTLCALVLAFIVPTVRLASRPKLWVESLAMSADGSKVAAILSNGVVKVWEADTGKGIAEFFIAAPIGGIVALSADGRHLAIRPGWTDRIAPGRVVIELWDVNTRRRIAPPKSTMGGAMALAPAQLIVAVCDARSIKLYHWDEPDQPPTEHVIGKNFSGPSLAFSPDGKLLACGSHDWKSPSKMSVDRVPSPVKVSLFDWENETTETDFDGPTGTIAHTSVSFSPDGRRLAVCTGFGFGQGDARTRKSLEIRAVETGQLTASLPETNTGWWRPSVAFLPDGRTVVVASDDLLVWDVTTQTRLSAAASAHDSIRCVAAGREGGLFATGGRYDMTIWDATTRKPRRTIWGRRVSGPSWLLLPGFGGWLIGWLAVLSRKYSRG